MTDAADGGRTRRIGNRQEPRGVGENEDCRRAVERERRRRVGGVETDRQHDARDHERRHAQEAEHVAERDDAAVDHIGDGEREPDRRERSGAGIYEGIDDRLLRLGLLEQQIVKILEREIVERKTAPPRLGEGGLQQHRHRQQHRERAHEERVAAHDPAPGAEPDHAALAALAGHRRVAAPADDRALQPEHQHGDDEERQCEGGCLLDPHRRFEELPQLGRDHVEARRQRDQRGRAEQRDCLEEADDQPADDRRHHQRQGDAQGGLKRAGAQDVGGVLHLGGDEVERGIDEDEDVRKRCDRDHEDQARHGIDVEHAVAGAGCRHPQFVEPAGVGAGEQDPADRAEIGRRDEGAEHHQAHEAFGRHVGARDRPGDRHAEQAGEERNAEPQLERIEHGAQVAQAAVGLDVVREGEAAGVRFLEARDDEPHHRARDQEHQHRDQHEPQRHAGFEEREPADERAAHDGRCEGRGRRHCSIPTSSCPAKAGHPVTTVQNKYAPCLLDRPVKPGDDE
jgi:hypothetical protein